MMRFCGKEFVLYPKKLTRSVVSNPDYPVVQTTQGKVRGLLEEGVFIFRGVPFAQVKRFAMPEKVTPWEGTRRCNVYGTVCKEIHTPIAHDEYNVPHFHYSQDEDCLNLNIWTKHINEDVRKPVMVWFHGGGHATGSSIELYAYDGMELADFGDVVVVSVNHRLNCIGYLDLSEYGEKYRYSGNLGTADLVASLQWVHDNIAGFGGDPDNVTIFGQSGGGQKVATMLQTPAADGLYHKAIIQSGLLEARPDNSQESAREMARLTVEHLGLTKENIEKIETVPYYVLARAAQQAAADLGTPIGTMINWGPVLDYDYFLGIANGIPFREETKHIPMLVGNVLGEFDQNFNCIYAEGSKNDWDDEKVDTLIKQLYGTQADAVRKGFAKAYPDKKIVDCLYTSRIWRQGHKDYCNKRAAQGCAPVYNWMFSLELPMNGGTVAWHNADEAYMFHNANYLEAEYIPGVSEELQDIMTGAWVAFAYTGDPNHPGMAPWPPVKDGNGACMIFDRRVYAAYHHDDDLMAALDPELLPPKEITIPIEEGAGTFGGGPRQSL